MILFWIEKDHNIDQCVQQEVLKSINYVKDFLVDEIQGNVLQTVCETAPLTLNGSDETRPTRVLSGGRQYSSHDSVTPIWPCRNLYCPQL